jgi:hypothetical protein
MSQEERTKMRRVGLAAVVIAALLATGLSLGPAVAGTAASPKAKKPAATAQTTVYTCPMHPKVKSAKPGKCPICGMKLVAKKVTAPAAKPKSGTKAAAKQVVYTCPMHPKVKSAKPGKCPVCGMNLVAKKKS